MDSLSHRRPGVGTVATTTLMEVRFWIRPNGEMQRLGPSIDPGPNKKNYRPRYDADGQITQEHSTGEMVTR